MPLTLFASLLLFGSGIDKPLDRETARQIGLAQLRRWTGDPELHEVDVRKAGRCWIVTAFNPPELDGAEVMSEPFAVTIGPDGRLVRASAQGPLFLMDELKRLCLRARVLGAGGRWIDVTSAINYRLPAIRRKGVPRFGTTVAKLWAASGEVWRIDDRGTVQIDGKVVGALEKGIKIERVAIPKMRRRAPSCAFEVRDEVPKRYV